MQLLQRCVHIREISYLKSFKVQQDEDDEDQEEDNADDEDDDEDQVLQSDEDTDKKRKMSSRSTHTTKRFASLGHTSAGGKTRRYFQYVKHAIENATNQSKHVNMRPCYGFDITPSSGHLLDKSCNIDFIETSLPRITPPSNDFHMNLLNSMHDEDDD
jgi:hypothetical protein